MSERVNDRVVNTIFGVMLLLLGITLILGGIGGYFLLRQQPQASQGREDRQSLPTPTPQPTFDAKVVIAKNGFFPTTILVRKGSQITWTNNDQKPHSLSSPSLEDFSTDTPLKPNDSYSYIFDKKGTFDYYDSSNSQFKGTIVVK